MSTLNWRKQVTEQDVDAIHNMVRDCGVFSKEEIEIAVELAQDALKLGEKSHYHFLLAQQPTGPLLGYTCFGRIPMTAERYDLYWIVVDPTTQQRGIASELMAKTETAICELKGKIIYAETSSRSVYEPAHRFYRKQGFAELARLKDYYSDGDDKIIFGKRL